MVLGVLWLEKVCTCVGMKGDCWRYQRYYHVLALVCKEIVGDIKGIIMDLRWYVRRFLEISKVLLTLLSKSK